MDEINWELLAYDIANMLDRNTDDYGFDLAESAIKPNLPAFIAACQATQAELDAKETDHAR